ncbi:conserved hypothetical protein [Clostridium neonatale]|nr:conserved hypothetical protein [Clostridium neonatale]CAI4137646.1 conserved hypothetical protein [Clostridium neonatale]
MKKSEIEFNKVHNDFKYNIQNKSINYIRKEKFRNRKESFRKQKESLEVSRCNRSN